MKSGKILVVDDNKGIRDALKILLGGCFTQVLTLSSPTSLTSTVEQMMPDVILLDMNFKADINSGNEGCSGCLKSRKDGLRCPWCCLPPTQTYHWQWKA